MDLSIHVQAQGRLVEEQDARMMDQCCEELALHPFSERKLAHGLGEQLRDIQHLCERADAVVGLVRLDLVHGGMDPQAIQGGGGPRSAVAFAPSPT